MFGHHLGQQSGWRDSFGAIWPVGEKSGRNWRELVERELATKPDGQGAASWLRVRCLLLTQKESKHGG